MAYLIDLPTFGDNVRYYRKRQGYTSKQLADLCLYPTHVIEHLESASLYPSGQQLTALQRALHVQYEQLIMPRRAEPDLWESC